MIDSVCVLKRDRGSEKYERSEMSGVEHVAFCFTYYPREAITVEIRAWWHVLLDEISHDI